MVFFMVGFDDNGDDYDYDNDEGNKEAFTFYFLLSTYLCFPSECASSKDSSIGVHQTRYEELGFAFENRQHAVVVGFFDWVHDE